MPSQHPHRTADSHSKHAPQRTAPTVRVRTPTPADAHAPWRESADTPTTEDGVPLHAFVCRHEVILDLTQRKAAAFALTVFAAARRGRLHEASSMRLPSLLSAARWEEVSECLLALERIASEADDARAALHTHSAFDQPDADDDALLIQLGARPGYGPYMDYYADHFTNQLERVKGEAPVMLLVDDIHLALLHRACDLDALLSCGELTALSTACQDRTTQGESWWALWHALSAWTPILTHEVPPLTPEHPAAMAYTIAEALNRYTDDLRKTTESRERAAGHLRRPITSVPHVTTPFASTLGIDSPSVTTHDLGPAHEGTPPT